MYKSVWHKFGQSFPLKPYQTKAANQQSQHRRPTNVQESTFPKQTLNANPNQTSTQKHGRNPKAQNWAEFLLVKPKQRNAKNQQIQNHRLTQVQESIIPKTIP